MKTRKLGRNGPEVSEVGFGAWAIGGGWGAQSDEDSLAALHRALDAGVTLIDTAAGYGDGRSERLIGQILKERQQTVTVATKTPPSDGEWPPSPYCRAEDRYSEDYLRANLEERMKNLGTDRIDVLQLHTWTRAWNRDPKPLKVLRRLQDEGLIGQIGISTPEHDQNCAVQLMRDGWVDVVQVIYNIFEQEPAAELLEVAALTGTGIIVRVPFDEGALTGKFNSETVFAEGDFRGGYFGGDRLERAVQRAEAIRGDLEGSGLTMAQAALQFILAHPAVSAVIPGMRNPAQAVMNTAVSDLPDMSPERVKRLHRHNWRRSIWYGGK